MIDFVLGLIAFASLTTLVVEIWVAIVLLRVGRQIKARVERVAGSARSIREHVETIAAEVGKSQMLASRQIGRVEDAHTATMSALGPIIAVIAVARSLAAVIARLGAHRR